MEQPLVSVLTVTRNRGNLLRRCVNSVLSQTYKNIEHIVVDGASDDNTDEVMAEFNDERLHFVKLESNWPIKETLDYGISLCKGKYITFLDSDDEYLPEKVEKQVRLIESLPEDYGFVYCWMTYYDTSRDNVIDHLHNPQLRGDVRDEVVTKPIISGTPTLLFRTSFFRKIGGWKDPKEIGIVSDWEMCARACQMTKVDYVPEPLVNVYINHGSIRQSDSGYYSNLASKNILFAEHFLKEFAPVFEIYPKRAYTHYESLFRNNLLLKEWGKAWKYWFSCFKLKPSFRLLVLWPYLLIKKG